MGVERQVTDGLLESLWLLQSALGRENMQRIQEMVDS